MEDSIVRISFPRSAVRIECIIAKSPNSVFGERPIPYVQNERFQDAIILDHLGAFDAGGGIGVLAASCALVGDDRSSILTAHQDWRFRAGPSENPSVFRSRPLPTVNGVL